MWAQSVKTNLQYSYERIHWYVWTQLLQLLMECINHTVRYLCPRINLLSFFCYVFNALFPRGISFLFRKKCRKCYNTEGWIRRAKDEVDVNKAVYGALQAVYIYTRG